MMEIKDFGIDISIPLEFGRPQPNAFGVESATAKSLGDTRKGSSVNFEQITFVPHCNGTHTECVGHITNERISVLTVPPRVLISAELISVEPERISNDDFVITPEILQKAIRSSADALVVRTLPNDNSKLTRRYDAKNIPPYFTTDAMRFIRDRWFTHLLVDLPSIDRLYDDGRLLNHRIFWNMPRGSRETDGDTRIGSTITELIYVPNEVGDGEYLLNLQIAPFESDAAPSRPILIKPA